MFTRGFLREQRLINQALTMDKHSVAQKYAYGGGVGVGVGGGGGSGGGRREGEGGAAASTITDHSCVVGIELQRKKIFPSNMNCGWKILDGYGIEQILDGYGIEPQYRYFAWDVSIQPSQKQPCWYSLYASMKEIGLSTCNTYCSRT